MATQDGRLTCSLAWTLSAMATLIRGAVALADHRALISADVVQDDAFYYLVIARNWLEGLGPSFDGVTTTNGFHPLFMALVAPVVALSDGDLAWPIHAIGILLSLCAGATALLLFAFVRDWAGSGAAVFVTALFSVSPYFVFLGVNAQETGLAMLLGVALLRAEQRWLADDNIPSARQAVGFGVLAALAILARLDSALLVAAIGFSWFLRARRRKSLPATLRRTALAASVALALWLPWGATSVATTGAWLPTSGSASREIALNFGWVNLRPVWQPERASERSFDPRDVPPAWYADVASKQIFVQLYEQPLLAPLRISLRHSAWPALGRYAPYRWFEAAPLVATTLAFALMAAGIALLLLARGARGRKVALDGPGLTLVVYWLLMFIGYTFYAPAHWYHARYLCLPILLTTAYVVSRLALVLRERLPGRGWWVAARAIAFALVAFQLFQLQHFARARLRWSDSPSGGFLQAWEELSPAISENARVGAFQAGIYGWFGGGRVVNLDGKVNPDARRALAEQRLAGYIDDLGIEYLIDWEWVLHMLALRHVPTHEWGRLQFEELERMAGPQGVVLYRLHSAAAERPGDPGKKGDPIAGVER